MKHDFESLVQREPFGSIKWSQMRRINPDIGPDVIPLSAADMELKNAPEIMEGLKEYLDTAILGYTSPTQAYYDAVCGWMEKRHGWHIEKEWIVETAGVVPAIVEMVGVFTEPDDAVLIMTPVYYPFSMAAEKHHRKLYTNELIVDGDTYRIDFDDLEEKAKRPETKLLIFCSPHNPVGRIWTYDELVRIGKICLENDVFIISDEIHFDLILPGYKHITMGVMPKEIAENCAICTAPSKTFNLAGMQTSNIIIPGKKWRSRMTTARGYFSLNALGYKACEFAYTRAAGWLDELMLLIDKNRKYVEDFMAQNIPEVKVFRLEGTYLQWMDFNALGMDYKELERFMQFEAQLFLDEGYLFGEGGKGFERINLACPTKYLEYAMERLLRAVNSYKAKSNDKSF
jgi:putative C-S lyase